jgi:hypothetical protein
MEFRNPVFTANGDVDCEVNHPRLGWIPFTASPDDVEEHGREIFDAASKEAAPYVAPPASDRRGSTAVSRADFCIALVTHGLLTAPDAIAAAKGDWPQVFANALSGLPQAQQVAAQITWATAAEIHRLHPLILAVQAKIGLTDAQVDGLFGL